LNRSADDPADPGENAEITTLFGHSPKWHAYMVADEDTDGKATACASHRELLCVIERLRGAC
jgi:hypothetical protein